MNRTQKILVGVFVAQLLLIVLIRGPLAQPMTSAEARPLLPSLESFSPKKLEIRGSEDERVALVREDDSWHLAEVGDYPADSAKVEDLIEKLKGLKVQRPVVASSRYHSALKVTEEESERHVRIWDDPSGSPEIGLFLGSSPNYRITHVRVEGDDLVYEVSGLGVYDFRQTAAAWIDTHFVNVESSRVTSLRIENAGGTLELAKTEDDSWEVRAPAEFRSRKLDTSKVDTLIRSLASIFISEPAGALDRKAQGFDRPAATVFLRLAQAKGEETADDEASEKPSQETEEFIFWIGKAVEDNDAQRYITRSGFDFTAIVLQSTVEKLLTQKVSDLQ